MNNKIITGGVIGAVLILLFFWTVVFIENRPIKVVETPAPVVVAPIDTSNATYQDPAGKFSLSYPKDFTVSTSSLDADFPENRVAFLVSDAIATGTNLGNYDSGIYVTSTSTSSCLASTFSGEATFNHTASQKVTINGISYSTLEFSEGAAGNLYDTTVYAFKEGNTCYGLSLYLHSGNIGNYDPGTVKEFDKAKLLSIFSDILASFKVK